MSHSVSILSFALSLPLLAGACMHNVTPASQSCSVLNDKTQLAACVGKTVTVRGRVSGAAPTRIAGVLVEAPPELQGQPAHAFGTLESDRGGYVLKEGGALAKAHSTGNPR
jgi:hypothetical protein